MPALDLPAPLVSTGWLAEHLGDDRLVVVDASVLGAETHSRLPWLSGLDDYLIAGHVPGAVFADVLEEFSDTEGRLRLHPALDRADRAGGPRRRHR